MKPHETRNKLDLIKTARRHPAREYLLFWGHTPAEEGRIDKSCLSQWYDAAFHVDGQLYRTAEHYMMAGKARLFRDRDVYNQILEAETPRQAKRLGRQVKNFDGTRWGQNRQQIVQQGNLAKFGQHPELLRWLLRTQGAILVEASPYDLIWGIGIDPEHPDAQQPHLWPGQNLLGFCLMEVRQQLGSRR